MAASKLPQQFGQYVLQELIARGGMAEIYRATTHGVGGFEKTVAIKKILPHLAENDEFITMLIDEARIIVNLSHANIAQVYDLGKIADDYYIAMEYIHGTDLSTITKELKESNRTMPVEHALFIASGIAAGLHVAHAKCDANGLPENIVHRDVSPHNILLSFAGDVKIIDFGVAKARGKEAHTQVGVIKGKLLYMAPEQAMGKELDGRADLFAMGLILYRMLTNHLPFEGDNEFQIYNNILSKPVTPPRVYNPNLPEEVNQIVMMLLQRDPSKRYQDGYSAKVDLDRALQRVAPGYSMARLSRWVESEFSHLIARRKLANQSGLQQRPVTPSHAHNANATDAGFTPPPLPQSPPDWEDFDEGEDTLNVSMNSPEAQAMLDRVRAERAAAGKPPAPPEPPWNVEDATNESPSSWQQALMQPEPNTTEQPQQRRATPYESDPYRPDAYPPELPQQADPYQPYRQQQADPYARATPQPSYDQPQYGEPAGSGMYPFPQQKYGEPAGSGMYPFPQQQYGEPAGSGMYPFPQQPQQYGERGNFQGQQSNYGAEQLPHGSGIFQGSGMFPTADPNMYGGQSPRWDEGTERSPRWDEGNDRSPAGSGMFGAPPMNASGAMPAYYGPSRQSGAFGALGQLPPQPAQPYETYAPQQPHGQVTGGHPVQQAPSSNRGKLLLPAVAAGLLVFAIVAMILVNVFSGDEVETEPGANAIEALNVPLDDQLAVEPANEVAAEDGEAPAAEDEVEPVEVEAAPEMVVFNATTEPAGAEVFLGEEALGTTPLEVTIPRGEDEIALRFELDGYETQQLSAIPFNDFKRKVELKRIAPEPTPQEADEPKRAEPAPKKAEPKKTTPKSSTSKSTKASTKKSSAKKKASIPLLGEEPPKTSDADIPLF